eukprot:6290763-Prymnesium_polylepis.2
MARRGSRAWSVRGVCVRACACGACVERECSVRGACVERVWSVRGACVARACACGACVARAWRVRGACAARGVSPSRVAMPQRGPPHRTPTRSVVPAASAGSPCRASSCTISDVLASASVIASTVRGKGLPGTGSRSPSRLQKTCRRPRDTPVGRAWRVGAHAA